MNDIIHYGSPMYLVSLFLPIIILLILWYILHFFSKRVQWWFIFILMMINLCQHIFKAYVWYPLYHGEISLIQITFYNICATSILLSPIIFISKNKVLNEAIFYFGVIGGIFSVMVPYGYEGAHALTWNYARYAACHAILLMTSALPVLLGITKPDVKRFWSLGFVYMGFELLVFSDNVFFKYLANGHDLNAAYLEFYNENPMWICHPPIPEDAMGRVWVRIGLTRFIYNPEQTYTPIIWSCVLVWLVVSFFSLVTGLIFFRRKRVPRVILQ